MNWTLFLFSLVICVIISSFGLTFYITASDAIKQINNDPNATCTESVLFFLQVLKFFTGALTLYCIPLMIAVNLWNPHVFEPYMKRMLQLLFSLYTMGLAVLWMFLLIFSGIILYYERAICDEGYRILWVYCLLSAGITGIFLIIAGFDFAAFHRSRGHSVFEAATQEMSETE